MNDIMFAEETAVVENVARWRVLIVDDDESVHVITKSVLKDLEIDGRRIEFYSAFSGEQAIQMLSDVSEIAVVFLDVVMETNEAGLEACRRIREELNNHIVRIVLRTGQPGSAPEHEVIVKYRINDYREKTDLSSAKLFSCVITAVRSFQDLMKLEHSQQGLRKVIRATNSMTAMKSIGVFLSGIIDNLSFIVTPESNANTAVTNSGFTIACRDVDSHQLMSATGEIGVSKDSDFSDLPTAIKKTINDCFSAKKSLIRDNIYTGFFCFGKQQNFIFCLAADNDFSDIDKNLLHVFSANINIALDNLFLNEEIINTQKELIEKLGEVVEKRSSEASQHVKRVADFSYQLAMDYGLNEAAARLLNSASPMHDVGKVGIPDAILLKPGKLTEDEFEVMKTHAQIGYEIFMKSDSSLLKAAAIISLNHHEKWDGNGYPNNKKGEDIHIFGRITAVADVFDALYHARCYKPAWPIEEIVLHFQQQSGLHFDPKLVEIVLADLDKYQQIVSFE